MSEEQKLSWCNVQRMLDKTPAVPKSCKQCGLGPCERYMPAKAAEAHRAWSIGVSSEGPGVAPLACPMPSVKPAATISEQLNAPLADETRKLCDKAPPLWQCTRNPGHLGPCAAVHDWKSEYVQTRTTIGQVINDVIKPMEYYMDASEIDEVAQAVIAKLRPDLIPVANPVPAKAHVMDANRVKDYINARDELEQVSARNTFGTFKYPARIRDEAACKARDALSDMLASEKELDQ